MFLLATRSLILIHLESYFYLFSIWNDKNICINWEQTHHWAQLLDLKIPQVFYRGLWDEKLIRKLQIDTDRCEGYVVRTTREFHYESFDHHVAKWVRRGHLTTDSDWIYRKVVPNGLNTLIDL